MKTESIIKPPQSRSLKGGRVKLKPGEEIGWHTTDQREELIIPVKGKATVKIKEENIKLGPGQTYYVPEGIKHNVTNQENKELEYIYVVSLF